MTEESKEIIQVMRIDDKDWFLQDLVDGANKGNTYGITLTVNGFLISGSLIGGKEYFEGFANDFIEGIADPAVAESFKASITQHGEIYTFNDEERQPPSYIHLKEAKFFNTSGNPIPGNKGVWWRGRISQISGFHLGILSVAKSDENE